MRNPQPFLAIAALVLCLPALGTPIPGVVSTGVSTSGSPATDDFWTVTVCPGPCVAPFSAFLTDATGFPFGAWLANDLPNSAWISPQSSYTSGQTDAPGLFEYALIFDLSGLNPATAAISFFVAVDNDLNDVLLNGASQSITASGYASLSGPFAINSGFQAGSNTLTFVTENAAGPTRNPSGLRVEIISAEADLNQGQVPEPATLALTGLGLILMGSLNRRRRRD